jgi:transcriptional regulator with XRE-family HTH domain
LRWVFRGGLNKQIGQRIREKREYIGLSREKFSEMIGISPQFLAEIEGGKKGMSSSTLYKMCVGLSASADYIVLGKERPNDVSNIVELLSNLDVEYLSDAEDIMKSFIIAINRSKRDTVK